MTEDSKREMARLLEVARTSKCETEADRSLIEYSAILSFALRENFIDPQTFGFRFDEINLIRAQRYEAHILEKDHA